ncbi:tetratricopeptide repeat protein [bacterium]|nr:tetratricopeptide repeat protein [bacterium]
MSHLRKEASVQELLQSVRRTVHARMARPGQEMRMEGPLFTFLIGAGFSLSAGVPSTGHLTSALELFQHWINKLDEGLPLDETADPAERLDWEHIFEVTRNRPPAPGSNYYELMDRVLPLPPARHDFITAAIQWAAANHLQMTEESILLAAILIAGSRGFSGSIRATQESPLASSFARHVFTTNFDELLPLTFYIGNRPADVVDSVSYRMIDDTPEFPTVVYLHGRHIHYDLKNTPEELKYRYLGEEGHQSDLFAQFRRVLRRTGLIVIGYSGAEDRVMEVIEDALNDPHSLPYGLWWSGYSSRDSLSRRAQELIDSSPRASYLLPESGSKLPALQLMEQLCYGIGLDALEARIDWVDRAQRISRATEPLMTQALESIRGFLREARQTYFHNYSVKALEEAMGAWDRRMRSFVEKVQDLQPQLAAEVLNIVALILRHIRRLDEALDAANLTLTIAGRYGLDAEAADAHWHLSQLALRRGEDGVAEHHMQLALEHANKVDYAIPAGNAHFGLGDLALKAGRALDALTHYQAALERHQHIGDTLGVANGHEAEGDVYLQLRRLPEARSSYERALELHREAKSSLGEANDLQGLCAVALLDGRLEEANSFYHQAEEIMQRIAAADDLADVHVNFAAYQLLIGNRDAAMQALAKARDIYPSRRLDLLLAHGNWLSGDRRVLGEYRRFMDEHGPLEAEDLLYLEELIAAGQTSRDSVEELLADLTQTEAVSNPSPA